jgi:hypothetical protein
MANARARFARPRTLLGVRRLAGRPYVPLFSAVLVVVAAALMTWSQQRVPAPEPSSAEPTSFSAERPVRHVEPRCEGGGG